MIGRAESSPPPPNLQERIAYFDCFSGVSGNMALGAMIDAGLDVDVLQGELSKLAVPGLALEAERTRKNGIMGTHVRVHADEPHPPERTLADITAIVAGGALSPAVQRRATDVFRRLAQAEAAIHGVAVEEVHFHEVGAVDAIADVVGFAVGLTHLGVQRCYASSLPMGRGMVKSMHGTLPLPAPATLALLAEVRAPLHHVDIESELVTPTGAALLAEAATFARPPMRIERVGVGLGTRELPWPNILRIWLGDAVRDAAQDGLDEGEATVLEANLDDATPEEVAFAMERLFAAGALDVFFTPVQMKKNRPGVKLTVLGSPALAPTLARTVLRETTSLGVRFYSVARLMTPRRAGMVETAFGELAVKVKTIDGEEIICPEYEECARVARERGVPIRQVYAAVLAADPVRVTDERSPQE
jgi:pyridinium-3,5-bisthiocarboxylic acid mononucleotide nickel chelatase